MKASSEGRVQGGEVMLDILPGIGLGPLRFKMTKSEIANILGEPEEVAEFDSDQHLYYPSLGIFLFFEAEAGGRLSGIEVNARCRCSLEGELVFAKKRDKLTLILQTMLSRLELPTEGAVIYLDENRGTRITTKAFGMDFYFNEDGLLESINWSPAGDEL
jgi:hypothetical protein